jgi:hypothetical protein
MGQTPRPERIYNQLAGTSLDRLAGISDGIFSVGMTLLVLGLAVPPLSTAATDGELWHAISKLGPNVLVYLMSVSVRAPRSPGWRAAIATTCGSSLRFCSP